jgi:hypothetical protein
MKTETPATNGTQPETANMSVAAMAADFQRGRATKPATEAKEKKTAEANPENEQPEETETDTETETETPETETETPAPEHTDTTETETEEQTGDETETETETEKPRISQEVLDAIAEAKLDKGGKKMVKRIHKLVDERDGERNERLRLERDNHQLKAQLQQAGKGGDRRPGAANLSKHPDMQALVTELEETNAALSWLESNPEGGEVADESGKKYTITEAEAKKQKAQLEAKRTKLLGKQGALETKLEEENKQRLQSEVAEAAKRHAWLKDKESKQFKEVLELWNTFAGIENSPGFAALLTDAVAYRNLKAQTGERKTTITPGKPAAKEPTPQAGKPATSAPKVDGKQKATSEAEQQFEKTGSAKDLANLFAKRRQTARA